MPVSNFDTFKQRCKQAVKIDAIKSAGPSLSLEPCSLWTTGFNGGAIPSAAAVCTNTTVGALNLESTVGNSGVDYRLLAASIVTTGFAGQLMLMDRLSHQGGLSGTSTSTQTTNLPTAALTRYTDGVGVMGALEIYTAIGGTATTATVSYTNQAGTPGRTSKPFTIGGNASGANSTRFLPFPLQDGDLGVRSVESVTLAASTGITGNFGVTLFKPLALFHNGIVGVESWGVNQWNALLNGGGFFEKIEPGACLFASGSRLGTGVLHQLSLSFVEVS